MSMIALNNEMIARVDPEDAPSLRHHRWTAHKIGNVWYAVRNVRGHRVYMHREILQCQGRVDHRDRDGLNNTRQNLRCSSASKNAANAAIKRTNSSGYKGVSWDKKNKRWFAKITVNRHQKFLGYFDDPREAALAYDRAAIEAWGVHARPNILLNRVPHED